MPCPELPYLATVVAVGIFGTLFIGLTPLIVGGLVTTAHLTVAEAGYCASLETTGTCLGIIAALSLERRAGARRLIICGMLGMLLGNGLSAGAAGLFEFAAARLLSGIGGGLTTVYALLLARTARPQRNFAFLMGCAVIATSACSAMVPALLRWGGIAGVYLTLSFGPLACLFAAATVLPKSLRGTRRLACQPPKRPQSRTFSLAVWVACLLELALTCSISAIWTYLGAFGIDQGVSQSGVSFAVSLGWLIGGTLGAVASGVLEGHIKAATTIQLCASCFLCIIALLAYGHSPALFYVSTVLFVFIWSVMYAPLMVLVATVDPAGRLAMTGVLLQTVGFAIGPGLGAAILHFHSISAVAWTAGAGFGIALAAVRIVELSLRGRGTGVPGRPL